MASCAIKRNGTQVRALLLAVVLCSACGGKIDKSTNDSPSEEPVNVPPPQEPAEQAPCSGFHSFEPGLAVVDMSADGSTLVGHSDAVVSTDWHDTAIPQGSPFRYRIGGSVEWLDESLQLISVSADGNFIGATQRPEEGTSRPVRIVADGQIEELPVVGEATAISEDGQTVVGAGELTSSDGEVTIVGFRWTPDSGVEFLPAGPHEDFPAIPLHVSADGSVMVGGIFPQTYMGGSIWKDGVIAELDIEYAEDLSADGTVAVGWNIGMFNMYEGGVAVETASYVTFGFPTYGGSPPFGNLATFVNSDGSIVFGGAFLQGGDTQAAVWQRDIGVSIFQDVLQESCAAALPQTPWSIVAISGDGLSVVGCGADEQERGNCWSLDWSPEAVGD